jgi:hypothetical protein
MTNRYSGILKAVGTDGTTVGFLGTSKNTFGEYEIVSDATAAAPLSFSASSSGGIFEVSDSVRIIIVLASFYS